MEHFLLRNQQKPKSDIEVEILKYLSILESKISKSEIIEDKLLEESFINIKIKIDEYNTKINNWYDDDYYKDLMIFNEEMKNFDKKNEKYEELDFLRIK
jgi:hypothetical protein